MPWMSMIAPVAGALLGGSSSGSSSGGSQTVSKDPWAPAQPWLTSLLGQGQSLQNFYQQNPFNALQQGAYANLLGQNDYINSMTPGLLAQFSQPTGFDRSNPRAKPAAIQFPAMTPARPMLGLLTNEPGAGNAAGMNQAQSPYRNGLMAAAAPAATPAATGGGFNIGTQQGMIDYVNSLGGSY